MTIRVFVLDDHELVREGVVNLLSGDDDIEVVGQGATAAQALRWIPMLKPHVAVLDVRLSDGSGIDVCREIRSAYPEVACLMLTAFEDDDALYASVMAGASGFVLKQIRSRDLIDGVKKVAAGTSLYDASSAARIVELVAYPRDSGSTLDKLSPQERRLLEYITEGLTNRQIAEVMFLSEKTVKNYITSLLRKLHVTNRTGAAVVAARLENEQNAKGSSSS